MKNGEGNVPSEVISPDPLDGGFQKSDGGDMLSPVSSQYSSCGDSEFERYCSANSVMGTPGMCSSMGIYHDFGDSDVGSVKSLEGFSLGGERFMGRIEKPHSLLLGQPRLRERELLKRVDGTKETVDNVGSSMSDHGTAFDGAIPMLGTKTECKGMEVVDGETGKREDLAMLLKNVENALLQGAVAARSAAETLFECNDADEMEDERCREQDESSSRYGHSDGENSMFGSETGSQHNTCYTYMKNVEYHHSEDEEGLNLLLMNPSVAFGSKDWEDFVLDGGENFGSSPISNDLWEQQQPNCKNYTKPSDCSSPMPTFTENLQWHDEERSERVIATGDHHQRGDRSLGYSSGCSTSSTHFLKSVEALDSSGKCKQLQTNDGSEDYLETCSVHNIFEKQCPPSHVSKEVGSMESDKGIEARCSDKTSEHDDHSLAHQHLDPLPDRGYGEALLPSMAANRDITLGAPEGDIVESSGDYVPNSVSSRFETDLGKIHGVSKLFKEEITTNKGKDFEMNAFCDELVHEMEEILLDSRDSPGSRLKQRNALFHSQQSSPLRDGVPTASTSGLKDGHLLSHQSLGICKIEVVGAKQKTGDISLSERLVGVRGYTVYVIRVWSGNLQWEVERRYRDFYSLYLQLKTSFGAQGWSLPPPWSSVEQESRKFFGNSSPFVIAERSTLIQECLCSVLQTESFTSPPTPLMWFLSPPENVPHAPQSNATVPQSTVGTDERVSNLGKTISLIVESRPQKSVKELLDTQHYTCAGCHRHFDNGKTRMREIVQTFGWGKPRLCEYTGQLFCSSCHTNDTAVLPARILHHWDFTPYPVSQLAKSYLDSIIDQPMLCVSAANHFLFSRVPTLLHIVGVRRRIGAMLPYIHCSFRRVIYGRLGYRKYLLETNDFFAIRDLIDLSKGAFAALPSILESVLKKMLEHITELCLECCDSGIPCGARQACGNPSSLIFPFQDDEVQRCKSCKSVFHKHCYDKLAECPCRAVLKASNTNQSIRVGDASGADDPLTLSAKKSELRSMSGFLSGLFSVTSQEKPKGPNDSYNVILMGSLPSTSL